jgi:hypothetical protein
MNGYRSCSARSAMLTVCYGAALLLGSFTHASDPTSANSDAPGVEFKSATGTYSVHRAPTRSLDEVMQSMSTWQDQKLADGSTAKFTAEDGILSMECSACGLSRPSAIEIASVDLDSVMAYEAGVWHIGMRSKDGSQDFFGVLRGEAGLDSDAKHIDADRNLALTALIDLYDLIYLTQNSKAATTPTTSTLPPIPTATTILATPAVLDVKEDAATNSPVEAPKGSAPNPTTSLAELAALGDVESIQAQVATKTNSQAKADALLTAYGVRARTQMLEGQIDASLQTLKDGRQQFGKATTLRDLEAHYVVIGDAYDRLRFAVKINVTDLQEYLQQIRTLEPGDAKAVQKMLAQTLANRIADQKAAARNTIADDLLNSGRDLFPDYVDLLSQGTAGALPTTGVEIKNQDGGQGK